MNLGRNTARDTPQVSIVEEFTAELTSHQRTPFDMHRAVSFLLLALACAFTAAAQVTGIHSKPLVSVVLVTCGRPEYLKLALAQIHEQSYPNLEVVLVVDGTPVDLSREPRLHVHPASSFTTPSSANLLDVRVVQFDHRATVGEKRNAPVLTARGEILVHWDDDDLYDDNDEATTTRRSSFRWRTRAVSASRREMTMRTWCSRRALTMGPSSTRKSSSRSLAAVILALRFKDAARSFGLSALT